MAIACNRIVCRIPPTRGHNGQNEPSNHTQGSAQFVAQNCKARKFVMCFLSVPNQQRRIRLFQLAPAIIGHAQPCLATAQNAPGSPWLPSFKNWRTARLQNPHSPSKNKITIGIAAPSCRGSTPGILAPILPPLVPPGQSHRSGR